jgi:hypothetical protein
MMKKQLLFKCFLLSLLIKGADAYAQSSGGMGIYNINAYQGTATVSIPIADYASEEVPGLGVSISYNTSGVKVDEQAKEVGLNWNLNFGPKINRVVKDIPDELGFNGHYDGMSYNPYSAVMGRLASNYYTTDSEAYIDQESDDFIVSLGGSSFTFNIGKTKAIFTNPEFLGKINILSNGMNLDSLYNITGVYPNFEDLEFEIIDANLNKFYFKKTQYKQEIAYHDYTVLPGSLTSQMTDPYNQTLEWGISKIIFNDGKVVKYNYDNFKSYANFEKYYSSRYAPYEGLITSGQITAEYLNIKSIKSIQFPNGVSAEFNFSSIARCDVATINQIPSNVSSLPIVEEIVVKSDINTCLRYKFKYSYSFTPLGSITTTRTPLNDCITYEELYPNGYPLLYGSLTAKEYFNHCCPVKVKQKNLSPENVAFSGLFFAFLKTKPPLVE